MHPLSIRLSPKLYKALVKRSKEMGDLKLSDTIRRLLRAALESEDPNSETTKVKNKQLQYMAGTYYLLNEYILSLGEDGQKINRKAHTKAEKVVFELIN